MPRRAQPVGLLGAHSLKKAPELNLKKSGKTCGEALLLPVEECAGKIAGADICLYPPGVPVIYRGDILDKNAVQFIKDFECRLSPLAYGRVIVLK